MNNFNAILAHYREREAEILATPANEWAFDAYEWERVTRLTPIEAWLWSDIREANVVMYPQYPVGKYFVDFANPVARLAIECDGAAFHKDKEKDARRDTEIEAMGWSIFRISGSGCRSEYDEETGELGMGRQFIELLAKHYPIKRLAKPPEPNGETARRIRANLERLQNAWQREAHE